MQRFNSKFKFYAFVAVSILIAGCSDKSEDRVGCHGEGFALRNSESHNEIIKLLEENNINYWISDRASIQFMLRDQAEIKSLVHEVNFDGSIEKNRFKSRILNNEREQAQFEKHFRANNVSYRVFDRGSSRYIEWSFSQYKEAEKAIQEALFEYRSCKK
ncbi:hypothetical protein [Sessilibacter corallicola]|uniref:Lipoprotein n=1 Tax=Sessilibacter corallicola TaxID=2904075 RepID=A0ABQ0A4E9_9GAMM